MTHHVSDRIRILTQIDFPDTNLMILNDGKIEPLISSDNQQETSVESDYRYLDLFRGFQFR